MSRLNNDLDVRFFAVTIDQSQGGAVLSVFLKLLMADSSTGLLRLKGIVATEDRPDRPALIDISATSSNPSSGWKPGPPPPAAGGPFSPPPTPPRTGSEPC